MSKLSKDMRAAVALSDAGYWAWIAEENRAYARRHRQVKAARGQARHYRCACGRQAAQWSQTHGTTGENPSDYIARCVPCHIRYDRPGVTSKPLPPSTLERFRCHGPCDFCWPAPGTIQPDLINQ